MHYGYAKYFSAILEKLFAQFQPQFFPYFRPQVQAHRNIEEFTDGKQRQGRGPIGLGGAR
jgi:hypothetical protein